MANKTNTDSNVVFSAIFILLRDKRSCCCQRCLFRARLCQQHIQIKAGGSRNWLNFMEVRQVTRKPPRMAHGRAISGQSFGILPLSLYCQHHQGQRPCILTLMFLATGYTGYFYGTNCLEGSSIANCSLPCTWLRALGNHLCFHHSFFRYRESTWWRSSRAAAGWSTSFQQTFYIIQLCPWQEKEAYKLIQKPLFHWSVILPRLNHLVEFTCESLWSCTFLGVPLT